MAKNRDDKTFIVKADKALKALPYWLKDRCTNTCSFSGTRVINVGHDTRPDSDWGGKYQWRGRVVVLDENLFEQTLEAITSHHAKVNAS